MYERKPSDSRKPQAYASLYMLNRRGQNGLKVGGSLFYHKKIYTSEL